VDVLLVPSLSLERSQMELVTGAHHYEERQLFSLVRLRHPGVRMVYASSKPLGELVVDAVLELLPGVPTSHARRRLHLFDTDDASDRPLTAKLLERPALLSRIGELLRPGRSFISCFVVSDLERQLSERLQVPLLGCDPALAHWGSKAGSRELFARCDVPHPPGSTLVHSLDDLAEACAELWETHPQLQQLVVKLNEGFSGEGNARLALAPLQLAEHGAAERRRLLRQALEQLPMPAPRWRELVAEQGALAEAWLEGGEALSSPSVQGTIHPGAAGPGTVELLSSHEQVLGGPDGQTYQGCSFPAAGAYRAELLRHGRAVGEALAAAGALERFALDFIARRFGDRWDLQAIEVNLRQGGHHPPVHRPGGDHRRRQRRRGRPLPRPYRHAPLLPRNRHPAASRPARSAAGGPDRHRGRGWPALRSGPAARQRVPPAGLPLGVRQAGHDLHRPQRRRG
jgi:hypothetical protein